MSNRTLSDTAGILLAGTHPWTNSAFDSLLPRPLLPVAHRPLIWHGLSWLHRHGISEVAICGNREARALRSRVESVVPDGMTVSYREDRMPRGAGGSARDAALSMDAETFVVADGTAIPNVDLSELLLKHHTSEACITVVVHAEPQRNARQQIYVPCGIYVFSRRALDQVAEQGFCDIKEKLIPHLYEAGERVVPYLAATATPRVLDASTYMAVNEWMIERLVGDGKQHDDYVNVGNRLVHRDAFISDDATLVGPVLVGPGARVMPGAIIVGPSSIGHEVTIAAGAIVSRSAVWMGAVVADGATVDGCILADHAAIESGSQAVDVVVVGNRRHSDMATPAQPRLHAPRRSALDVGVRLGRLVFGGPWSRSTVAR